jgi:hypothetical protein
VVCLSQVLSGYYVSDYCLFLDNIDIAREAELLHASRLELVKLLLKNKEFAHLLPAQNKKLRSRVVNRRTVFNKDVSYNPFESSDEEEEPKKKEQKETATEEELNQLRTKVVELQDQLNNQSMYAVKLPNYNNSAPPPPSDDEEEELSTPNRSRGRVRASPRSGPEVKEITDKSPVKRESPKTTGTVL